MNIIEAIKSGKPYRRKNLFDISSKMKIFFTPGDERDFSYSEVLADDWEVENKEVTITREQLLRAYIHAGKTDDVKHGRIDLIHATMKLLGLY
jgi:hypothetical protein